MGLGITVSILAKVEGWLALLKLIQDAFKNMKADTNIGQSMAKDLKLVETLINNIGKNFSLKLTSDALIDSFVNKMTDIEHIFLSLGTSMSSVSFSDLKPEYITLNFLDLLNAVELANAALGAGMNASLQGAVADSKELTKEFEKMKLDPKDLNMDLMKEALASRGDSLTKDLSNAQKEAEKLKTLMQEATRARDELISRGKEIKNTSTLDLLGQALPQNGTIWNDKLIDEAYNHMLSKFISLGATKLNLKILPDIKELMKESKWDELPQELLKILSQVQSTNTTNLGFARLAANDAVSAWRRLNGAVIGAERAVNDNERALGLIEELIRTRVAEETRLLREELELVKLLLNDKATAETKNTGTNIKNTSSAALLLSTKTAEQYHALLGRVKAAELALGKLLGVVLRWFSIYAVIRMVSNAVKSVISTIKELDTTITDIAIVTNMNQDDLWKLMPKYTQMAREYGASISGTYKVSLLYYQLGLQQNDVMALTEATLKMARISGLEYADATNYMTNAVRSFKMEMTEANTVVDVYSSIAASSATSVTELATAMSKTASSALAVGASFENTTAMMAVMIEATRESPENIGSAMKSIISRYGELKENKVGMDEEGEEYSLNKVDTALQSVGISIHDAKGEFRDFDDVIMELSESWDKIDKNTQRYIATVMAGNRQQSRFLALVSSGERLKELSEEAANSEDASQLQFLKSLDSVDTKIQQLQTSILALYTNSGIERLYKDILDYSNAVITTLDNVSDTLGIFGVITKIGTTFASVATLVSTIFTTMKLKFSIALTLMTAEAKIKSAERALSEAEAEEKVARTKEKEVEAHNRAEEAKTAKSKAEADKRAANEMKASNWKKNTGMVATGLGLVSTMYAATLDENEDRERKAWFTAGGGILLGLGTGLMMGGVPGALMGIITAIPSIFEAIGIGTETTEDRIKKIKDDITNTLNLSIQSKDEYKSLTELAEKLRELESALYDSAEAKKAYLEASNAMAESYPELISYIDEEGNKIVELTQYYEELARLKAAAARDDAIKAGAARIKGATSTEYRISQMGMTPDKKDAGAEGVLGYINGLNLINNDGIIDMTNTAYNDVIDRLNSGFDFGTSLSSHGKWDNTSTLDMTKAVFGTNFTFTNENSPYFRNNLLSGLQAVGLTGDENFNLKYALNNLEGQDVYQRTGYLIEGLMDAGKNLDEINTALTTVWQGNKVQLDYNLWAFRSKVKDNEKYISTYGDKAIKNENLALYSETLKTLDIKPNSAAENAFMLNQFLKNWDIFYAQEKKVAEEQHKKLDPSEVWTRFAALSEDYIKLSLIAYSKAIAAISDETMRSRVTDTFENLPTRSVNDLRLLRDELSSAYGEDSPIVSLLTDQLTEAEESIKTAKERFINAKKINNAEQITTNIVDNLDNFSSAAATAILEQYTKILKNDNFSDSTKLSFVSSLDEIYLDINTIKDSEKRDAAIKKVLNLDFTSLNDLYLAASDIEKLNLGPTGVKVASNLKSIASNVSGNLVAEFESLNNKVLEELGNFNTAISNATKGMNLKEATKMADKMGKKITDFRYENGKYFYDNLEDIEDAYLISNQKELLTELETRKDRAATVAKNLSLTKAKRTFDMSQIDDLGYLQSWRTLLEELGLTPELLAERNAMVEGSFTEVEKFDINRIGEEGYLESWKDIITAKSEEDYENLVLAAEDGMDHVLADLSDDKVWSDYLKITETKIPVRKYAPDAAKKWENIAAGLEVQEESLGTLDEWLTGKTSQDKESALSYIRDAKNFLFDETLGLTRTDLANYVDIFLSDSEAYLNMTFSDWLKDYLDKEYQTTKAETDKYVKDQTARAYLSNGNLQGFAKTIIDKKSIEESVNRDLKFYRASLEEINTEVEKRYLTLVDKIVAAASTGDIDNLDPELQLYAKLIYDTFKSTLLSVMNSMFEAVSGGETKIFADDKNIEVLKQFADKGWIKKRGENGALEEITAKDIVKDGHYEFDTEVFKKSEDEFYKWLDEANLTQKERAEYIKKFFDIKYPKIKSSKAALGMLKKETITTEDLLSYMTALGKSREDMEEFAKLRGLAMNVWGEWIIEDEDAWFKDLEDQVKNAKDAKELTKALAQLDSAKRKLKSKDSIDLNTAVKDVVDNYDSFSEDLYEKLLEAMGDDWEQISQYISGNEVEGYRINLADLKTAMDNGTLKVANATKKVLNLQVNGAFDEAVSFMSSASSYFVEGTTSRDDMAKFQEKMDNLYSEGFLGESYDTDIESLFSFDEVSKTFKLNEQAYADYVQAERERLMKLGYAEQQVTAMLVKSAAESVDIDAALSAANPELGKSKLKALLLTWLTAKYGGKTADDATLEFYANRLLNGGEAAVEAAKEIAKALGRELTAEEMQKYYAPLAEKYSNWASLLAEITVGQYIGEGDFRNILTEAGVVDTNGVVQSVTGMVKAYLAIYDKIKSGANATQQQINSVYAQLLTAKEQGDIDAIAAMGEATNMTYDTLGLILAKLNISLETWLQQNTGIYEKIGAGKIRITDFTAFASQMGWQPGSEEYTSAFKTYNDSIIELDRKTEKTILDEVKSVESAKAGDKLNLTLLYTELLNLIQETVNGAYKDNQGNIQYTKKIIKNPLKDINRELDKYGASLEKGILSILKDANLLGIAKTLANATETLGLDIAADIQDMVLTILLTYTNAITSAINGSISNVEALELILKSSNMGLNLTEADFTKTANGLKLSLKAAIKLYRTMSAVDGLLGEVVFGALRESLEASNAYYKTSNTVLARTFDLTRKIALLEDKSADSRTAAEKELLSTYREELLVAKEIAAVRLTEKDDSWDFMNDEEATPPSFENYNTYWKSWADARKFLSLKNKKTDPEKFLPLLKHVSSLAQEAGKSLKFMGRQVDGETYAQFMSEMYNFLSYDKDGNPYFSNEGMRKFGFNMQLGEEGISEQLWTTSGEHMAKALLEMAARNQFYSDLFEMSKNANVNMEDFANEAGKFDKNKFNNFLQSNQEFNNAFTSFASNIKVNGATLLEALQDGKKDFKQGSREYQALQSIFEMIVADDWDASKGYQDIKEHLLATGLEGEVQVGDFTYAIKQDKILSKDKNGKWSWNGQEFDTADAAFAAMSAKEDEDTLKELHAALEQAGKNLEALEIEIEGKQFTFKYTDAGVEIVNAGGTESWNSLDSFIQTQYQQRQDKYKELSLPEWKVAVGLTLVPTISSLNGNLNAEQLTNLRRAGLTSAEKLQEAWGNTESSHIQFKTLYGIDLEAEDNIDWVDLARQINMDELATSILSGITNAFSGLSGQTIASTLGTALSNAFTDEDGVPIPDIKISPEKVTADGDITVEPIAEATGTISHLKVAAEKVDAEGNITGIEVTGTIEGEVNYNKGEVEKPTEDELKVIGHINWENEPYTPPIINDILKTVHWTNVEDNARPGKGIVRATGNLGLATGNARAQGTLIGELGPELVVSNGHYFVAGLNGPEMVDLADDAIVFNHLQTKSLLEKGMSRGRGQAVTNERKAVAFAQGSGLSGLGANASLRQADIDTTPRDKKDPPKFDKNKKRGKGDEDTKDLKAFIKELERWYNWLQEIARLELKITKEETLRTKLQSDFNRTGKEFFESEIRNLDLLLQELLVLKDLVEERKKFFAQKRNELNSDKNPFSLVYKFDEHGLLKYQDQAFELFSNLSGTDRYTNPNFTPELLYNRLLELGVDVRYLDTDASGNKIDKTKDGWQQTAMLAFYEKMDKLRELMLSEYDAIEEGEKAILEELNAMNEILHAIENNLIEVELKVLKAFEESKLRAIDDALEQRDALEKASDNVINGLSELLQKEQDMYSQLLEVDELSKLQRQLAIMLRSGGSAALIADLQSQIAEKQQSMYFDMQLKQIDALLEASDNELERLDHLIDIMTELLEYEKENGLLWNHVNEILLGSSEDIVNFILGNTAEYWNKSTFELEKVIREDLFKVDLFKAFTDNVKGGLDALIKGLGFDAIRDETDQLAKIDYIKGLYLELLGREGEEGGINYWLELMSNGMSYDDVRTGFMNSTEYKKLHGITDISATNTAPTSTNSSNNTTKTNSLPVYGYYALDNKGNPTRFVVVKPDQVKTEKDATGKTIYKQKNTGLPLIKHAKGGYNYETGLAWLDGTKDNPEAVLNSEQTRILRNNILSSRPDSLVSLLKSYNEAYHGLSASTYDSISNNTNNATVIERAEVNLLVAQLANDYDSRRAANTIMDEMLRIASKTSANNSVRR